jgi:hypothetical protein
MGCHTAAMAGSAQRTAVISLLKDAARESEAAVGRYLADGTRSPGLHFTRPVTLALALLGEYAERAELSEDDLALLRGACSDAAAVCRVQPPSPPVLEAAERFAQVEAICNDALGKQAPSPECAWRRFLFPDCDLEVARVGGRWRVRSGGHEVEQKLLDAALDELFEFSNSRYAELTVQILSWHSADPAAS